MRLRRAHPQFFLVVVALAAFHLWTGAFQTWGGDELFSAPTQVYVYEHLDRTGWGVAQLSIGTALALGLTMPTFDVARLGLAAGAFVALGRLWYQIESLVDGAGGAIGVATFALIAVLHIAATLEPPSNPAARR